MDAFRKFNFDSDEGWKAYLRNVELPAGDHEAALLKVKAKWYKRNVDADFDTSSVVPPARTAPGASPGRPADPQPASNTSTSTAGTGGGSSSYRSSYQPPPYQAPPPRYGTGSGTYGSPRAQQQLFFLHAAMVLLGLFSVVPFLPYSRTAYVFLLRCTILASGYKLYLQFGLPSFRPLSSAMAWLQRAMPTTDFMTALVALTFAAQPPMMLVAVPPTVLAAYHAAAYCAAHFSGHPLWQRHGARLHALMLAKQTDALQLNAFAEVATGLLLVLQLLTPLRSLLTTVFYAQILKLKLHLPDSAVLHRQVWSQLDARTRPYWGRLPVVPQVVEAAKRYMLSVPQGR